MHWMHPRVTMKCCLVCVCSTHSAIILVGLWLVFSLTVLSRGSMAEWSDIQTFSAVVKGLILGGREKSHDCVSNAAL
jgi:hypothetical protein